MYVHAVCASLELSSVYIQRSYVNLLRGDIRIAGLGSGTRLARCEYATYVALAHSLAQFVLCTLHFENIIIIQANINVQQEPTSEKGITK